MSTLTDDDSYEAQATREAAPSPVTSTDKLTALVSAGDIAGARAFFDEAFWAGKAARPGWRHLKVALLREDRPMLRLLNIWGAAATENDLAAFRTETGGKYLLYLQFMKAAGLRPPDIPSLRPPDIPSLRPPDIPSLRPAEAVMSKSTTAEITTTKIAREEARPARQSPAPYRAVPRYDYDREPLGGSVNYAGGSSRGNSYSRGTDDAGPS